MIEQVTTDLGLSLLTGLVFLLATLWRGYCRMFGCGVFSFETDAITYLMFLIVSAMMYILLQGEIITYRQGVLVMLGTIIAVLLPQLIISKLHGEEEDGDFNELYNHFEDRY